MTFRSLSARFLLIAPLIMVTSSLAAGNPAKSPSLNYDVHMSDCENHWVALYHKPEDSDYTYGFVYIDPQAGFTVHIGGRFTIDANGKYSLAPNPIPPDKMTLKIRLEDRNGIAALLPPEAVAELGLPERPDWLKFYEDDADPITHKVKWGFFYNSIGDSRRALDYLEPAYKERPDAPRVVFELTYAYNATGRPEDAIRVAKSEFTKNPKDELLCREIAFAYLRLKSYADATGQYQACIALCADSESGMAEKSELAMNLSAAYAALSDTTNRDAWLEKAKSWAPKGSAVYKHFHPGEE
jgi:tetratricopeptide (TPR) repeat protein